MEVARFDLAAERSVMCGVEALMEGGLPGDSPSLALTRHCEVEINTSTPCGGLESVWTTVWADWGEDCDMVEVADLSILNLI